MIKVKHFTERADPDDGPRIWVEPISLARDLREWCAVEVLLSQLGPPRILWEWFEESPEPVRYHHFKTAYHRYLVGGQYRRPIEELARSAKQGNLTLLHQGVSRERNTAVALRDLLEELAACTATELPFEDPDPDFG